MSDKSNIEQSEAAIVRDLRAEIIAAVNEHDKMKIALDAANGNTQYAAILLGWSTFKLKTKIATHEDLQRYVDNLPPTDIDVMSVPERVPTSDDLQIAKKLEEEDALFSKDLSRTGFTKDQVIYVLSLSRLTRYNFKNTLSFMHGGMSANFIECQLERQRMRTIQNDILSKLADESTYPYGSGDRLKLLSEANTWARRLRELDDVVIRTNEVIQKGALTQILAKRKKQEKVGFKPSA